MNKILILCLLLTLFFYYMNMKKEENYQCNFNRSRDSLKNDLNNTSLFKNTPMWECNNWTKHPQDFLKNVSSYHSYRTTQRNLIGNEIKRLKQMRDDPYVKRELKNKINDVEVNRSKLEKMIDIMEKKNDHVNDYYKRLDEKNNDIKNERKNLERKNELLRQYFKRLFF